jgi:hypothetical protein
VFFQLGWIGLFGTKWAFLHFENCDLLGVLLSKSNSNVQGNNVLDSAASNIDGIFGEIHVFLQLSWIGELEANRSYVHLETPKLKKVFLSKTRSVVTEKQWCLDDAASNIDDFLWRHTCVSST